ncbi:D-alanine--D-alanine ligase [Candidatus Kaiserbacteria bacterium]|nr:D-alanine--D-alanine ligase [Candidatus Kaiserbacteria bacterium]
MNNLTRVGVLRGGPSEEYFVSLSSGTEVLKTLKSRGYNPKDIVITKSGVWLDSGREVSPVNALKDVDVVFLALHGTYGEDGQIQKLLQELKIPFTGSSSFASATAFNKDLTKQILLDHDVLMPSHVVVSKNDLKYLDEKVMEILNYLGNDLVIKPIASGSSCGVRLVKTLPQLQSSLVDLLCKYDKVLVEEKISGREATCGVLEKFRAQNIYILPPVEIVLASEYDFFDIDAKYNGTSDEICPGRFTYGEKEKIQTVASLVHNALGLSQLSRSDFIIRDGEVYFLEVNTLPGLTKESLFPKATQAVGLSYTDLIEHLINTATV